MKIWRMFCGGEISHSNLQSTHPILQGKFSFCSSSVSSNFIHYILPCTVGKWLRIPIPIISTYVQLVLIHFLTFECMQQQARIHQCPRLNAYAIRFFFQLNAHCQSLLSSPLNVFQLASYWLTPCVSFIANIFWYNVFLFHHISTYFRRKSLLFINSRTRKHFKVGMYKILCHSASGKVVQNILHTFWCATFFGDVL